MKKTAIIGAGGLTGKEMIKIISTHPELDLCHITSDQTAGSKLSSVFPDIPLKSDLTFKKHSDPVPSDAIVALAVPNQASMQLVPELLDRGHKVVDLSGSFRIHDTARFEKYYGFKQEHPQTLARAVFGMPELFREKIKTADLVANPGCYPTSVIIPLNLLGKYRNNIAAPVTVCSASGASGAGGRTEDAGFSFFNLNENFRAYKILKHQHQPEMEEYSFIDKNPGLVFTPHLLPVYRGILSTITIYFDKLDDGVITEARKAAEKEPFIRFYNTPEEISLHKVAGTNFIDISMAREGNTLVIVSAIDNLIKGAAGQAVQNINLMTGIPETTGLIHEL